MAGNETIQIKLQTTADIQDVIAKAKSIQKVLDGLNLPQGLKTQFAKMFTELEKGGQAASRALEAGFKTKGSVTSYAKGVDGIVHSLEDIAKVMGNIDPDVLREALGNAANDEQVKALTKQIVELQTQLNNIKASGLERLQTAFAKMKSVSNAKSVEEFNKAIQAGDYAAAQKALNNLGRGLKIVQDHYGKDSEKARQYEVALQGLQSVYDDVTGEAEEYQKILQELERVGGQKEARITEVLKDQDTEFKNVTKSAEGYAQSARGAADAAKQAAEDSLELNRSLDQFKNKITYFFGMQNAVRLFQRALRSAYDTIKDLDAVMTETAVVTDFSVGDMWSQLPEYTQRANELGVSIHEAYEAATLYYQQGLNTNQVMAVSNETLKMARIAGLDAAEATDRMTNAMRGFNMEITEANAQNVNDVYSNLAAKTASDVDEISTAMTKVASLANNANMSFENTGAFLAQIIETTRESAETAGTALKTIIARFSEVKELYSTGDLLGTDEEGQEIDVNKVSKALRTAGVDLNEYLTGAKGLDDIFMELSERWDSLDQVQQRYIATMAAGSRQQSRFIALMQDHARMTELVSYANDAAGASQGQFEKTLESLQSKLAQLKNAWDEFTMGIMNSDIVKWAIDRITDLIGWINKLTNSSSGLLSSISKIAVAVLGFFGSKKLIGSIGNKLLGSVAKIFGGIEKEGIKKGAATATGFLGNFKKVFGKGEGSLSDKLKTFFTVDSSSTSAATAATTSLQQAQDQQGQSARGAAAGTEEHANAANKLTSAENAASNATKENSASINSFNKQLDQNTEATKRNINGWNIASVSILAAGAALTAVGSILKKSDNDNLKAFGDILTSVGVALTTVGGIATALGPIMKSLGVTTRLAGWMAQSGWIWLLGVTAVIGAVVAAATLIKNSTPEAKLARLEKQTENAKQAAEDAKHAYEDLLSDFDAHTELLEELDNLTKGTQAWKEKLDEVNQSVSDLIQKYPELAKYVTLGDNGQLIINEEAFNNAKQQAKNRAQNASSAASYSQIALSRQKMSMLEAPTEFADGDHAFNINADENHNIAVDQADYERKLADAQAEIDAAMLSLITNAVDEKVKENKYSNEIIKLIQKQDIDENDEEVNQQYHKLMQSYGNNLNKAYQDLIGEIPEGMGETEKEAALKGVAIQNVINERGNELLTDIENKTEKQIESMFLSLNPDLILDKTSDDWANLQATLDEESRKAVVDIINGVRENVQENLRQIGVNQIDAQNTLKGLTYGFQETMSSQFVKMYERGGKNGVQQIVTILTNAQKNLTPEKYKAFAKAISELDLSSADDIEGLSEDLRGFGITADDLGENIDNVETQLKEAAYAAEEFDMSNVIDQLKGNADLIEQIKSGKLDEDAYNSLIEKGVASEADFGIDSSGNVRFTGDVDRVVKALENNTQALLNDTKESINTRLANAEQLNQYIKNGLITEDENTTAAYGKLWEAGAEINGRSVRLMDMNEFRTAFSEALNDYRSLPDLRNASQQYDENQRLAEAQNDAEKYGLDLDVVAKEADYIEEKYKRIYGYSKAFSTEIAVANQRRIKGLNNIQNLEEEIQDLLKGDGKLVDEQVESFNKVKETMNDILGASEDLSDSFYTSEENLKLMQQIAKGGTGADEALAQLQKNATLDNLLTLRPTIDDTYFQAGISRIINTIENTQIPQLEAGAVWDDDSSRAILNELSTLVAAGKMSAQEMNSYVNGMGFKVEMQQREIEVFPAQDIMAFHIDPETGVAGYTRKSRLPAQTMTVNEPVMVSTGTRSTNGNRRRTTSPGGGGGGKGSGKGSSGKSDTWENPYDKLYNTLEKIAEVQRERNKLENDYNRILNKENESIKSILDNRNATVNNLYREKALQKELLRGRQDQLNKLGSETYTDENGKSHTFSSAKIKGKKLNQLAWYEDGALQIDWNTINKITKPEEGEVVEAYIDRLTEITESIEETEDTLLDIDDQIIEVQRRSRENYLDLENRVLEALVAERQKQIDQYQALADVISEQNSKILDNMRESIEHERQIAENTKKEEDIANKQMRLAYLQRDTSGANQTEILKLQKEIDEARESHTNELIDQKISDLEKDNQKAEEQRQKQIQIMEDQLKYEQDNGLLWDKVYELMGNAFNEDGTLNQSSGMAKLLREGEDYKALSKFGKAQWRIDLVTAFMQGMEGLASWAERQAKIDKAATLNNGTELTYDSKKKQWKDSKGNVYSDPTYDPTTGRFKASKQGSNQPKQQNNTSNTPTKTNSATGLLSGLKGKGNISKADDKTVKDLQNGINALITDGILKNINKLTPDGDYGERTKAAVKAVQELIGFKGKDIDGIWGNKTSNAFANSKYKAYATGGLADSTGFAWLDGTKTKPELVLNAKDTENFIALKDMLARVSNGSALNNTFGNTYFDIDINADIGSDYDVDQLAARIKAQIARDGQYRNVNNIGFLR